MVTCRGFKSSRKLEQERRAEGSAFAEILSFSLLEGRDELQETSV